MYAYIYIYTQINWVYDLFCCLRTFNRRLSAGYTSWYQSGVLYAAQYWQFPNTYIYIYICIYMCIYVYMERGMYIYTYIMYTQIYTHLKKFYKRA